MKTLKSFPQRILIINIFGIGDVLFTTPLIQNLKEAYPDAVIDYISNRRTESVLKNNPHIRQVYVYERDHFKRIAEQSRWACFKVLFSFLMEIRRQKYDLLFDFSLNTSIGFMTWLSGVPIRAGFDFKKRGRFLNRKITLTRDGYCSKHMVEYYLDLLDSLNIRTDIRTMRMYPQAQDVAFADDFFKKNALLSANLVVGLVPGGGASWGKDAHLKRWPAEKYAKLADNLIENHSAAIILFGDPSEEGLCQKVADVMKNKPVLACGQTDLHQFSALTQKCALMILNDGGPLHMAVASGARTVSVFGPVDDKVYGPYPRQGHCVIRKKVEGATVYKGFRLEEGSERPSLDETTVEDVYTNIVKILGEKK